MDTNRLQFLLDKYLSEDIQPSERQELFNLVKDPSHLEEFAHIVDRQLLLRSFELELAEETKADIRRHFEPVLTRPTVSLNPAMRPAHRVQFMRRWGWAAAVILVIGTGAYLYTSSVRNPAQPTLSRTGNISPGTNRAVLTVGNKTIDLASNKTGIAVDDVISYNDGEKIADAGQLMQLTTPKGGQYQAVLPDGSKVWLNAASSIQFPSKFTGTTREIAITGEAYFEIVTNKEKPFIVTINDQSRVEVLGTSFNINSYADEGDIRTTLVTGRVKVVKGAEHAILQPGYQAVVVSSDRQLKAPENIRIEAANISQVLAWKNGQFVFQRTDIKTLMRQVARWYDVEVQYEGDIPELFVAEISREESLSELLELLELTHFVHFRVEGKKVVVMKGRK